MEFFISINQGGQAMMQVWKYPVKAGRFEHQMPEGAKALSVHMQGGQAMMWVLVDDDEGPASFRFITLGTGHPIDLPANELSFIGAFSPEPGFVFHLFRIVQDEGKQ
jgi:hypothetical protein